MVFLFVAPTAENSVANNLFVVKLTSKINQKTILENFFEINSILDKGKSLLLDADMLSYLSLQ